MVVAPPRASRRAEMVASVLRHHVYGDPVFGEKGGELFSNGRKKLTIVATMAIFWL
jgi:hypothetical protein